jgi:hypothetical protein
MFLKTTFFSKLLKLTANSQIIFFLIMLQLITHLTLVPIFLTEQLEVETLKLNCSQSLIENLNKIKRTPLVVFLKQSHRYRKKNIEPNDSKLFISLDRCVYFNK